MRGRERGGGVKFEMPQMTVLVIWPRFNGREAQVPQKVIMY